MQIGLVLAPNRNYQRSGGAREGWVSRTPSLSFESLNASSSPYINRFLSADTIVPGYANPQNLNRYSYVTNNPLRYIDPTGHSPLDGPCGYQGQDCGSPISSSGGSGSGGSGSGGSGGGGNGGSGGGGGNGGSGGGGGGVDYCATHPTSCGLPFPPSFTQAGSIITSLPSFPPSPFACEWLDCGLSLASLLASAATEVPEWIVPAMIVDGAATGIAIIRTNADYDDGNITQVHQYSLNISAGLGFFPEHVGVAFSFINLLMTLSGYPS